MAMRQGKSTVEDGPEFSDLVDLVLNVFLQAGGGKNNPVCVSHQSWVCLLCFGHAVSSNNALKAYPVAKATMLGGKA